MPRAALFTPYLPTNNLGGYGYGWYVHTSPDGAIHHHGGGTHDGFSAFLVRFPEERLALVILATVRGFEADSVLMACIKALNPRARFSVDFPRSSFRGEAALQHGTTRPTPQK